MKKIVNRSYKNYDYWGCACVGDVDYKDGTGIDKWDDIKEVIKRKGENKELIPIVKTHNDNKPIGYPKTYELDNCNKKVYMGLLKEDLQEQLELFNNVSPRFIKDENGKIVDIEHWAVSNEFVPLCSNTTCNISANRGEEPAVQEEVKVEEVEQPIEQPVETVEEFDYKAAFEKQQKEIADLKNEMSKRFGLFDEVVTALKNNPKELRIKEEVKNEGFEVIKTEEEKPKKLGNKWSYSLIKEKKE